MGLVSFLRSQKIRISKQHGFSLVELMVVVAIIGILASIAIPNYQRFQRKSRQSGAKLSLAGIFTSQKAFNTEWGYGSSCLDQIGFVLEGGNNDYSVGWASQTATNNDFNVGDITASANRGDVGSGNYNGALAGTGCSTNIAGNIAYSTGTHFSGAFQCTCAGASTVPVGSATTSSDCTTAATSGCNNGSVVTVAAGTWTAVPGVREPGLITPTPADTYNNITFLAGAMGDIGNGTDAWTINQQKVLTNTRNGL